jgi:hypothetical protein
VEVCKILGDKFNLQQFMDEFLAAEMILMSLIRWEMIGFEGEMKNYGEQERSKFLIIVVTTLHF